MVALAGWPVATLFLALLTGVRRPGNLGPIEICSCSVACCTYRGIVDVMLQIYVVSFAYLAPSLAMKKREQRLVCSFAWLALLCFD